MKGKYLKPSELLKLLKETGWSYWELVGNPLPTFDGGKSTGISKAQQQAFVKRMGPMIANGLRTRGLNSYGAYMNAMRLLAYESTYGTSPLSKLNHNYGGYGHKNDGTYANFKTDLAFADTWLNYMVRKNRKALLSGDPYAYANIIGRNGYYTDKPDRYGWNMAHMSGVEKYAPEYYAPRNVSMPELLVLRPDNTKVDRPILVLGLLKKPVKQLELLPTVEDEPIALDIQIPEATPSILPNPISFYNSMFGSDLPTMKHGKDSGIHIKPSHRGRFTRYLKAHPGMTAEKAKHSKSAAVRRMATFALNARKWHH